MVDAHRAFLLRLSVAAAGLAVRTPAEAQFVSGDRDVTRFEHMIELSRLFPDARLLVLPSGHGDYLAEVLSAPADEDYAEIAARLLERFLAEPRLRR